MVPKPEVDPLRDSGATVRPEPARQAEGVPVVPRSVVGRGAEGRAGAAQSPVVIKKYANRRLYNTEASSYVTLDDLAGMVRLQRDFVVYDAKTGDDITRGVLTQIIVEEESKGRSMLPESFLRQLIAFYGDSLQAVVPRYLEFAMAGFARQQEQMRRSMEQAMGGFMPAFPGLEEVGKQNMAMLERAMSLFAPFRPTEPAKEQTAAAFPATTGLSVGQARDPLASIEKLNAEIERLKRQLATSAAAAEPGSGAKPEP